mgnify:CR=1 FL=1
MDWITERTSAHPAIQKVITNREHPPMNLTSCLQVALFQKVR